MTIDEKIANMLAIMKLDYLLSDESRRIQNPKRNDDKYELLCDTLQQCYDLAEAYQGKLESDNPDFPCDCHLIELVFPTEEDEIVLREIKAKLANAINNCDEVNIDTDIKGNLRIHFGFEDVYTSEEA